MMATVLSWGEVDLAARALLARHPARVGNGVLKVWGVPTGGTIVAHRLAVLDPDVRVQDSWAPGVLVVDDLVDSGRTARGLGGKFDLAGGFDALFRKPTSPADVAPSAVVREGWLTFPWEHGTGAEDAVVRLLEFVGENPRRPGLEDTPARVCRALAELTSGYKVDPAALLARTFAVPHDELVILKGVRFTSLCEHHVLPFSGTATVGYIPGERIVGISKLARLVEAHARRLQVQERMAQDIAGDLMRHLAPRGAGVVLRAHHECMGCRGVRQPDAELVTSVMLGILRDSPAARAEFFAA